MCRYLLPFLFFLRSVLEDELTDRIFIRLELELETGGTAGLGIFVFLHENLGLASGTSVHGKLKVVKLRDDIKLFGASLQTISSWRLRSDDRKIIDIRMQNIAKGLLNRMASITQLIFLKDFRLKALSKT